MAHGIGCVAAKTKLRHKYADFPKDGIAIGFRFPDGSKVSRKFCPTDTTKVRS